MTVSIVETVVAQSAVNASAVLTVTTDLRSTDRVVVVTTKRSTAGSVVVTGLGGTWSQDVTMLSLTDMYVHSISGMTAGGNVTVNPNSSGYVADIVLYVLRSDVPRAIIGLWDSRGASGTVNNNSLSVGTPMITPAGAMVLGTYALIGTGVAGLTFPSAGTVPAAGSWTVDASPGSIFLHYAPSAEEAIALYAHATGIGSLGLTLAAYIEEQLPDFVVEHRTFSLPSSGPINIELDQPLQADDLVVVNITHWKVSGTPTISSSPATTWSARVTTGNLNIGRHRVWTGTGLVGATTITINNGGGTGTDGEILVFRGVPNTFHSVTQAGYGTVSGGGWYVDSAAAGEGQFAVGLTMLEGTSGNTIPSDLSPGEGWWHSNRNSNGGRPLWSSAKILDGPRLPVRYGFRKGSYAGGALLLFGTGSDGPALPRTLDFAFRPVGVSETVTIPSSTALVPSDLIVIVRQQGALDASTITVGGNVLTTPVYTHRTGPGTGDYFEVFTATGYSGPTSVVLTGSATMNGDFLVFIYRDLLSPTIEARSLQGFDGFIGATGLTYTPAPLAAEPGQVALLLATSMQANSVILVGPQPEEGWSKYGERPARAAVPSGASRYIDTAEDVAAGFRIGLAGYSGSMMLLLGSPYPSSGFTGWGIPL